MGRVLQSSGLSRKLKLSPEWKGKLTPHKKARLNPLSASREKALLQNPKERLDPSSGSRDKVLVQKPSSGSKKKTVSSSSSKLKAFSGYDQYKVRYVTVIVPDNGRSALTDCLVQAAIVCSPPVPDCSIPKAEASPPHNDMGLCIKSSDLTLSYKMGKEWSSWCYFDENVKRFVVNLINPPGPDDMALEATPSFCIPDGPVGVLDALKGFCGDTETLLCRAIVERVKPIYCVNTPGPYYLNLPSDGEKAYKIFNECIEKANSKLEPLSDKLIWDLLICPEKGTVAFWCHEFGWAFTLTGFAKCHATEFGLDERRMREKLWGDHFYDTCSKKWTSEHTGSSTCKRGFVLLCYEPMRGS